MLIIINGREMKSEEADQFIKESKAHPKFRDFLGLLENENDINFDTLGVRNSYVYDAADSETKELVVGKIVVLSSPDGKNNVHLSAFKREVEPYVYSFGFDQFTDGVLKQFDLVKEQTVKTVEYESNTLPDSLEEVPYNDKNFVPGESKTKAGIQAWYEFCAPGGYKHCGADCGDYGSRGGGTPINPLDTCCRAHDRCWKQYGRNDCGCDGILEDCARRYRTQYWVVANAIIAVFNDC